MGFQINNEIKKQIVEILNHTLAELEWIEHIHKCDKDNETITKIKWRIEEMLCDFNFACEIKEKLDQNVYEYKVK